MLTMLCSKKKSGKIFNNNSQCKAKYDESLIHNFTSNPKALYGYRRDKSKVRASISQIIKSDGSVTNDDHEVVEVFNGFFQSVFIKEDPFSVPMVAST